MSVTFQNQRQTAERRDVKAAAVYFVCKCSSFTHDCANFDAPTITDNPTIPRYEYDCNGGCTYVSRRNEKYDLNNHGANVAQKLDAAFFEQRKTAELREKIQKDIQKRRTEQQLLSTKNRKTEVAYQEVTQKLEDLELVTSGVSERTAKYNQEISKSEKKVISIEFRKELRERAIGEIGLDQNKVNVAFVGQVKAGKSSLINALRNASAGEEDAAETGTTETTMKAKDYSFGDVVLWDMPGSDTPRNKRCDYFVKNKLYAYDVIILLIKETVKESDIEIAKDAHQNQIPFALIRSRCDEGLKQLKEFFKIDCMDRRKQRLRTDTINNIRQHFNPAVKARYEHFFLVSSPVLEGKMTNCELDEEKFRNYITNVKSSTKGRTEKNLNSSEQLDIGNTNEVIVNEDESSQSEHILDNEETGTCACASDFAVDDDDITSNSMHYFLNDGDYLPDDVDVEATISQTFHHNTVANEPNISEESEGQIEPFPISQDSASSTLCNDTVVDNETSIKFVDPAYLEILNESEFCCEAPFGFGTNLVNVNDGSDPCPGDYGDPHFCDQFLCPRAWQEIEIFGGDDD